MRSHVVIGSSVYRLVEAQDPEVLSEEPKAVDEGEIRANFGALEKKVVDSLEKMGVKAEAPAIMMTREGFRYLVPILPEGGLEGSKSTLTFDFGTTFVEDLLAGNWGSVFSRIVGLQGTGISQVVWEYGGKQMVAPNPKLIEALLKSIAVLQKADARVVSDLFKGVEEGEMDEEKLKDWILNVADQMAEHGVGAEDYSQEGDIREVLQQLLKEGKISTQEHNYLLKGSKASRASEGDKLVSMNRLVKYVEVAVQEQMLKDKVAKEIIDALRRIEREPSNYFEKDRFYRIMQQGAQEGVFTNEELDNAQRAIDTFRSDAEWQEALRQKIEKKTPTTVSKEDMMKAVDQWSSQAGYNIEAGIQMTLTDEGTIAAAINAPFPFFYTFDTGIVGEITLLEAAMVFFDREVFVTPDTSSQLLKADVTLARALEQAVNLEMGSGTKPRTTQTFSDQLAKSLKGKEPTPATTPPSEG